MHTQSTTIPAHAVQGELFAKALLPRRLPVLKSGPEDEAAAKHEPTRH
jgi:hypothetical protein